jgi:DnaK suppressor protein
VSKSTAKSAAPAKKAAKKPAVSAPKATKKPAPAAKASSKAPVKAPAKKAPAKKAPPAKTAPAKKAPAPPAAKAAALAAPKAAPKPAPSPVTKTPLKATPTPTAKPAPAPKPETPAPAPKPSKAAKAATQPIPAAPQAQVSRFADRFAPARSRPIVVPEPARPAAKDPKLVNAWKAKAGRDLTEDELLAMPDAEYMNEKQLEFFRARLTALKDDLLSNAGETTEHLREDTSIVPDPADRATIEEEHALELRTRDRERKLLKKISQSLARIEAGDYGFCDETGEPIGLARLLARPTATLSLEAQQRREMKQKMFGD